MQKKSFYSIGSLLLLLVFFVVASMLSSNLFRGLRFDLTENQLYTLSDGTRNILHDLQEPVTLYLFFSEAASRSSPRSRQYSATWSGR
ncbi:Gldg family protein, partial [Pseudomonadota bacterium]